MSLQGPFLFKSPPKIPPNRRSRIPTIAPIAKFGREFGSLLCGNRAIAIARVRVQDRGPKESSSLRVTKPGKISRFVPIRANGFNNVVNYLDRMAAIEPVIRRRVYANNELTQARSVRTYGHDLCRLPARAKLRTEVVCRGELKLSAVPERSMISGVVIIVPDRDIEDDSSE